MRKLQNELPTNDAEVDQITGKVCGSGLLYDVKGQSSCKVMKKNNCWNLSKSIERNAEYRQVVRVLESGGRVRW